MQSENLAFEWNDVALLTDQRACTFLGKTMLRIPTDEQLQLEDTRLLEWQPVIGQGESQELASLARLSVSLKNRQGEPRVFQAEVPLKGNLRGPVQSRGAAQLLYSRGKAADGYLLLELILQIRQELQLKPTQVIIGQFDMEELLDVPDSWPECADILTTAAEIEICDCRIQQGALLVTGVYHLAVVYADESQPGECLFVCGAHRPFQWQTAVPGGLQEITGVQPCYQSLSVKQLSSRQIQLTGNGVICTLPEESEASKTETDTAQTEETVTEDLQKEESAKEVLLKEVSSKAVLHTPSVVNSRGSRRANLSKYMRDLNGMAQSPTSVRNFEIGDTGQGTDV